MKIFFKLKERYIIHKSYNIRALRIILYVCTVTQFLMVLLPTMLHTLSVGQIISFIVTLVVFSTSYIIGYLFDVFLFYIVFKKYVNNSIRIAEKQIAPLLFLQLLVPFIFNLIGCFFNIQTVTFTIEILQLLITILYLGYIVFGNIFKEKCVIHMFVYLVMDRFVDVLAILLKTGFTI